MELAELRAAVGEKAMNGCHAAAQLVGRAELIDGGTENRADRIADPRADEGPAAVAVFAGKVDAGVLDLATGNLDYCNAGHEPAWAVGRDASSLSRLAFGGPPFCVIDDFPFVPASHRLRPGETVCLVTDGVTEAGNAAGEFYGRARLEAVLARAGTDASPAEVGAAIREDVARFTAGADASDDLTIVVVTWRGGAPRISGR